MLSSLPPEFAVVRPRVATAPGRSATLLEEEVGALLSRSEAAHVWLIGPTGSGKRTALQHLAAVFADEPELQLLDDAATEAPQARVVVASARRAPAEDAQHVWTMAPWTDDDCFDYLLAEHAPQAHDAITAWRHPAPLADLRQWPSLCRAVLDHLAHVAATSAADHASAHDALCALAFVLAGTLGQRRGAARDHALRTFTPPHMRGPRELDHAPAIALQEPQLFRSVAVRALLAAEELLRLVADDQEAPFAPRAWPEPLIDALAHLVHADPTVMHQLVALAARSRRRPALLLSTLCAAVPGFRPPYRRLKDLAGARLPGIDLSGAALNRAQLDGAMVHGAQLDGAHCAQATAVRLLADDLRAERLHADRIDLTEASLRRALLAAAHLEGARLVRADLGEANLEGADLRGASLIGARLAATNLAGARLDGADLSGTDLRGIAATPGALHGARCREANLSGLVLDGVNAGDADFARADLGGTSLRGADLRRASFQGAAMADVDLEGADLRAADLRSVAFGLGGARSGLVGSDIAGEGSRTGFYGQLDDEPRFTAPEDLRCANLRGCDLRGARLDGVDLFRVDLRAARLDPAAKEQARRCRALLDRDES